MLKKNEVYEVTITGYTSEGAGVARIDGEAVFVPGAIEGEHCKIRIEYTGKTSAGGELLKVLEPSPHRVRPTCKYAEECGGCAFLHMDYEEETRLKACRVRDALNRIGGQSLEEVPITGAPSIFYYRNKAQYPVADREGKPAAGFYARKTHRVIPVSKCKIQDKTSDLVRSAVVEWMERFAIPAYNEQTGRGYIRHIYARVGVESGQVMACIVAAADKLPREKELTETLRAQVPGLETVVLSINKKPGNAVLGKEFRTLYGNGSIEDTLCGLRFRLSPQSFYQVNHDQAEQLYAAALKQANLKKTDTVLDLYCGTGTITLCLAREAGQAVGVEIIESAIHDAKENAARNGIENARFFCADAGEAAKRFAEEGTRPDVIVVDPPRKGLSPDVIEAMVSMHPERIVYVSCDPATLARDVKLLSADYHLDHAEAFDMFPRTAHCECVVKLIRSDINS